MIVIAEQYSVEAYLRATGVDQFSKAFQGATKNLENVDKTSRKASISIGSLVKAIAGSAAVVGAFNSIKNAIDGAISRYDTLGTFPKVLQQMGFSASQSEKSISKLSDGIQGLPTTLDDVASTTQRIATLTGDLEGATDTTLALNNAFILSGSSVSDVQRGLQQYTQMLSKGEVDLQSWRTLQETMGVALNDTAKAFGFAGESAQNDLYDALKSGEITFDQFNNKLIELNNTTDGFADRALTASGGIRTAWTNMNTAIVRGVTNIITAIDSVLADTKFKSIENMITTAGNNMFNALNLVASSIEPLANGFTTLSGFIEPLIPLVLGLATAFGTFYAITSVGSVISLAGAFGALKSMIDTVALSFMYLWSAMLANPIVAIISIVTGLAAAVIYLWNTNESFREFILSAWGAIKSAFEDLMPILSALGDFFAELGGEIASFTKSLASSAVNAFSTAMDWLGGVVERVSGFFAGLKDSLNIKEVLGAIAGPLATVSTIFLGLASPIGWLIKGFALLTTQTTIFSDVLSVFKGEMSIGELVNRFATDLATMITNLSVAATQMITKGAEIISGFILSISERLPELIQAGVTIITNLIEGIASTITNIAPVAVQAITTFIESIALVIPELVTTGVTIITTLINAIVTALPMILGVGVEVITAFVEAVVNNLPLIIQVATQLITTLLETVTKLLPQVIKTFIGLITLIVSTLVENLPLIIDAGIKILNALIEGVVQILPALIDAFIMIVRSIVELIIDNLPMIIDAGIEILTALIDGITSVLPVLIDAGIDLLLALVDTFIDLLPQLIDAGIQILMALIDGIISVVPQLLSAGIDLIIQLVGAIIGMLPQLLSAGKDLIFALIDGVLSLLGSLLSAGVEIVQSLLSGIASLLGNVLSAGVDVANNVMDGILSGDYLQIGIDIIQGLIDGATSMAGKLVESVKGVVDSAIEGAKKLLGIASPSKVFRQIGEWTGEGLVIGLDSTQRSVRKSSEDLAEATTESLKKEIDDIGRQARRAGLTATNELDKIKKEFDEAYAVAKNKFEVGTLDISGYIKALDAIKDEFAKLPDHVRKINSEIVDAEEKLAKQLEQIRKAEFDHSKNWIDEKKKYNELSLMEELAAWERVQARYKQGTEERKQAEEGILNTKQRIHDQLTQINEEYFAQVQDINQKMIEEEKALNEEYEQSLNDRTRALTNFAGIFDDITKESEVSGIDLIRNLHNQVKVFEDWSENIEQLAKRGIDEGLVEELRQMGPKAYAEIDALNKLSDRQLTDYSNLWIEKNKLAREQATKEMEGLRKETDAAINRMKIRTRVQLTEVREVWKDRIGAIRHGVEGEFNVMSASLPDIGRNAMEGLMDGIESMEGSLLREARSIANAIKNTMEDALDIHSPSRVMKRIGEFTGEGLVIGLASMRRKIEETSKKLANASIINPGGFDYQTRNNRLVNGGMAANNGTVIEQKITINSPQPMSPSETARKFKQNQRQLAMEWGL